MKNCISKEEEMKKMAIEEAEGGARLLGYCALYLFAVIAATVVYFLI